MHPLPSVPRHQQEPDVARRKSEADAARPAAIAMSAIAVPGLARVAAALLLVGALAAPRSAGAACAALPGDAFAFLPADPPGDRCRPDPVVRWPSASVPVECGFF